MIGLQTNASESEAVNLTLDMVDFQNPLDKTNGILKEVQTSPLDKLDMLGTPIFSFHYSVVQNTQSIEKHKPQPHKNIFDWWTKIPEINIKNFYTGIILY